jgi:hypothetical protein
MEPTKIYTLTLASVIVFLLLYSLLRCISRWTTARHAWLGSWSVYHVFLRYLVYPRIGWRALGLDALSPLQMVFFLLYFFGTGVCNIVGADTLPERGTRAAYLSLVNMFPLYFSGDREFGARLLGTSLRTYSLIHRMTGCMVVLQAAIHIAMVCQAVHVTLAEETNFYGFLASLTLCSPALVPIPSTGRSWAC